MKSAEKEARDVVKKETCRVGERRKVGSSSVRRI